MRFLLRCACVYILATNKGTTFLALRRIILLRYGGGRRGIFAGWERVAVDLTLSRWLCVCEEISLATREYV